ncbi:hypothetical protein, partial [Methylicorpusculum sp.]|uniref:hypothetical protein n=1 Tax=Methylicorpusculum sp. TaxID=2713644 RepID=UPI002ABADC3E
MIKKIVLLLITLSLQLIGMEKIVTDIVVATAQNTLSNTLARGFSETLSFNETVQAAAQTLSKDNALVIYQTPTAATDYSRNLFSTLTTANTSENFATAQIPLSAITATGDILSKDSFAADYVKSKNLTATFMITPEGKSYYNADGAWRECQSLGSLSHNAQISTVTIDQNGRAILGSTQKNYSQQEFVQQVSRMGYSSETRTTNANPLLYKDRDGLWRPCTTTLDSSVHNFVATRSNELGMNHSSETVKANDAPAELTLDQMKKSIANVLADPAPKQQTERRGNEVAATRIGDSGRASISNVSLSTIHIPQEVIRARLQDMKEQYHLNRIASGHGTKEDFLAAHYHYCRRHADGGIKLQNRTLATKSPKELAEIISSARKAEKVTNAWFEDFNLGNLSYEQKWN